MLVKELRGVGPKLAGLLKKMKIETTEDLLEHYPSRYEPYLAPEPIGGLSPGRHAIRCTVKGAVREGANGSRSLFVSDGTGGIILRWFHNPYVSKLIEYGKEYVFYGNVDVYLGKMYLSQPSICAADEYMAKVGALQPVYRLTAGLKNEALFKAIFSLLTTMPEPEETLPRQVLWDCRLTSRGDAIRCIHYPAAQCYLEMARRRLIFEEFYQLLLALKERAANRGKNYFRVHESEAVKKIVKALPYTLTGSQTAAVQDIVSDFGKDLVANRLVQGDVGSGKTAVAILAMAYMADNGFQAALMAPTEVLATQHYKELCACLERAGLSGVFQPVLLTGSVPEKDKKAIREKVSSGESKLIVGTHALIQEKVSYHDLALVIIDEQHRFGVEQRASLSNKGERPVHTVVMTATPIPRTTASILFGGMDISVMKDKPAGRKPVISYAIGAGSAGRAYSIVSDEVEKGHQAYIICPMVEGGEAEEKKSVEGYKEQAQEHFPGVPFGLMYGKMDPARKQEAMEAFASGRTKILVSTTVVEVGVNVPNATVILIENANMFGMLQLHQLRGRVGRGDAQSYCIFMKPDDGPCEKLDILASTEDGFEIAEADYRLRKAGSLLGNEQSGDMGFKLGDIIRDEELLKLADKETDLVLKGREAASMPAAQA